MTPASLKGMESREVTPGGQLQRKFPTVQYKQPEAQLPGLQDEASAGPNRTARTVLS